MKIAISTSTADLDSLVDPRFGRAPNFVVVDIETEEWEAYPNPATNARAVLVSRQPNLSPSTGRRRPSVATLALTPTVRW
jgi:hypothetical protein